MPEGGRHFKTNGQPPRAAQPSQRVRSPQPAHGSMPNTGARPMPRSDRPAHAAHAVRLSRPAAASAPGNPPRRRRRNIFPIILIVVGVALLLTAGGLFVKAQLGYKEAKEAYDGLEQYAVADDSGDGVPAVNFDELAKINPDVVGWIYAPGTVINYPVVQADNNSTYLTRMFNGVNNGNGAIFMDVDDAAPGVVDEQTTLYGHHMNDNSMFNIIDKSRGQAVFDTIKTVYYITRDATCKFEPMYTAPVQSDYSDARTPNFTGDTTLKQYLQATLDVASAKADDASELIDKSDKVLTLATCAWGLIPDTSRAVMTCALVDTTARQ